jgi:hypothetical protein
MAAERDDLEGIGSEDEEDASWDDWEEEEGSQGPTKSLLVDNFFDRAEEALEHDKRMGFDLLKVCSSICKL